jgi:hypothetical protein
LLISWFLYDSSMRLVVHPQRSAVSIGVLIGAVVLSSVGITLTATRPFHALMLLVLIPLVFVPLYTFVVFRRIELELRPGELAVRWVGWPYREETRILRLDDLSDIVVEEDDGSYRVVFLLAHERVPLTHSYTGDDLEPLVAQLKRFVATA